MCSLPSSFKTRNNYSESYYMFCGGSMRERILIELAWQPHTHFPVYSIPESDFGAYIA